ncbi:MAG: hypothetical protein SGJ21_16040 [Alphaproteobacteria bacterium]|nr:hypothetical protein [Alphaproteobacteria bacterium]
MGELSPDSQFRPFLQFGKSIAAGDGGLGILYDEVRSHVREMAECKAELIVSLAEIENAYATFSAAMRTETDQHAARLEIVSRIARAAQATGSERLIRAAAELMAQLIADRPRPMKSTLTFAAARPGILRQS